MHVFCACVQILVITSVLFLIRLCVNCLRRRRQCLTSVWVSACMCFFACVQMLVITNVSFLTRLYVYYKLCAKKEDTVWGVCECVYTHTYNQMFQSYTDMHIINCVLKRRYCLSRIAVLCVQSIILLWNRRSLLINFIIISIINIILFKRLLC